MNDLPRIKAALDSADLEAAGVTCTQLGPEGFAVLDTVRAAVSARRRALGTGVALWEELETGNSLAATVLNKYRTTLDLMAFGRAVARELLHRNAVLDFEQEMQMSGGGRKSLVDRLNKALHHQSIAAKVEPEIEKLRAEKQKHEDFLNKTTCMAMCKSKACGAKGGRCTNGVGEDVIGESGKILYRSDAGMHVDTKLYHDPSFVRKLWSFTKSVGYKFFGANRQDQYFGIGPWADKHLIEGWRKIDDGVMHICHYHADILRKKNRAYWAIAAAATADQVVMALTAVALANRLAADEAVADAVADGALVGGEITKLNNRLKLLDPDSDHYKGLVRRIERARYAAGAGGKVVVRAGRVLSQQAALKQVGEKTAHALGGGSSSCVFTEKATGGGSVQEMTSVGQSDMNMF